MQPCYCPNGTLVGTQSCEPDPNGGSIVGPCSACPTAPIDPTASALCPELQSQAGCMATTFRSEELPASVLFLVDQSGSMLCNAPPVQDSSACGVEPLDPTQPSKWDVTVSSLESALNGLVGGNVNAALSLFSIDGDCATASAPEVPLATLDDALVSAFHDALQSTTPAGRTPIVSGLIHAYDYMHWQARAGCGAEPCGAPGNRFVVLLTDGAESCATTDDQQRLLTETVVNARAVNIRTFVIGAPGSEVARGFLSELAFQGGTARSADCVHDATGTGSVGDCHFDMTKTTDFAADLESALGDIGGSVGCSFAVSGSGTINVQYKLSGDAEPRCLVRDDALPCDGGAQGWQFAKKADGTDDPAQVVVCGTACTDIESDEAAQVDVVLNCETLK